jgi:transcription factor C subunit 6
VKWNSGNGFAGARLLASGTASGICRIDWLEGRWMKGKIPYGSIANVRREMDTVDDMDVDMSMSDWA